MMKRLGTKAETLKTIYNSLQCAKVLPQFYFTVGDWKCKRKDIIEQFEKLEWNANVIVRSSALNEDTQTSSSAGKYESLNNICGVEAFQRAVEIVIDSYGNNDEENQVLIQPMLEDVCICGVAFTLDPNTLGHYYVINYDKTGSTSGITSGSGRENFLYYQFKMADNEKSPPKMKRVCKALAELEDFFGQENLDVEFAFTESDEIYILQVRPLCIKGEIIDKEIQYQTLQRIEEKIKHQQCAKPFLRGKRALYGVMTDWNPAEMIGVRPKPLAMSLYKEVITDNVWAYQRDNYGYRNLRSFPLMVDFGGLPYIDIRVSFNSFVPANLDEEISEKLVNYYLVQLAENPSKHDKAEFDIVFSCYTLDLPKRIQVLKKHGFTSAEIDKIVNALRDVTNHIIDHKKGLWRKDYKKIMILQKRFDEIMNCNMEKADKVYWLIEDCKRYGTLPFAGLARAAFIAVQILQSLVTCGIITREDYELFMNGVNTVSSEMNRDFREKGKMEFLKKYGHLRPGTYDINSLRYDEAPELYFEWNEKKEDPVNDKEAFRLSLEQLNNLKKMLLENGLTNDILELMDFIKTAIEGREYGKFAFTKNLSQAICMIGEIGKEVGISKEDSAYINIQSVLSLYSSTGDVYTNLMHSIMQGKTDYELTRTLTLPPLIANPGEVMRFYYPESEPNYITSCRVEGKVYFLDGEPDTDKMNGRILLISSADPGYDWIFAHDIKGFITMYGGANSHMAIRAGELGIPAVVGVGEKAFSSYRKAEIIEIDSLSKWIRILK